MHFKQNIPSTKTLPHTIIVAFILKNNENLQTIKMEAAEENAELIKDDKFFYDLRESISEELGNILLKPL